MLPLRLRSQANTELAEATRWYASKSLERARRFVDSLDDTLRAIRQHPEAFPEVRPNVRRALLHRFPYAVYYRVFPSVISVLGIIHGRRHPRRWLRRE